MPLGLVAPHGGVLINRLAEGAEVERLQREAAALPRIILDERSLADLELIAVGGASPLSGFLGQADYRSVLQRMQLADGTVWPWPLTLPIDEQVRAQLKPGMPAALADAAGRLWGVIEVSDVFQREAQPDGSESGGGWLAGGKVRVLPLPEGRELESLRLTPAALRKIMAERGWRRVAALHAASPAHRGHEHLLKLALEQCDGVILHPALGEADDDGASAELRFRTYRLMIDRYCPKERVLLAALPSVERSRGPRTTLFHALIRQNYGASHFIVARDPASEMSDGFDQQELLIAPMRFGTVFYCPTCGALTSANACPHEAPRRLEVSNAQVRTLIARKEPLPVELMRPEIAELLDARHRGEAGLSARTSDRGFIVWMTGLSGAGKSTLAKALRQRLFALRAVELLDGDEVRTFLSKGLGYSRDDRDINVARIAYVGRVLARNGVATLVSAISPYSAAREQARQFAEADGIPFIEVFVSAPLEVLIARDVKGLYKKALAGEIQHFTGVSDPYDIPEKPDIAVRTDQESEQASLERIMTLLRGRGLLPAVASPALARAQP